MRRQIGCQQKEIQQLRPAGIPTASAEALLSRMQAKVDGLVDQRDRLKGEDRTGKTYASGKGINRTPSAGGCDGQPVAVPGPWRMGEGGEREQCFRVYGGDGLWICLVLHRQVLHARSYQYADEHLTTHERRGGLPRPSPTCLKS